MTEPKYSDEDLNLIKEVQDSQKNEPKERPESTAYTDKDFESYGLPRSFFSFPQSSGDDFEADLKRGQELREIGKAKNRDIRVISNGNNEVYLEENGKRLGDNKVFTPAGLGLQDLKNEAQDPTNLAMLIPFGGEGVAALNFLNKAWHGIKTGLKIGGFTAGVDTAVKIGADLQNGQGPNLKDNITDGLITGGLTAVATPVIGKAVDKGLRGAGAIFSKTKPLPEGEVPLTRGQTANNAKDLAYENEVSRGEKGTDVQRIFQEHMDKQAEALNNKTTKDLGVSFNDPNRNISLGDDIKEGLANRKAQDLEISNNLYKDADIDNSVSGLSRGNTVELLNKLKSNIDKESVAGFGKHSPDYEAHEVLKSLEKGFGVKEAPKELTNPKVASVDELYKGQDGNVDIPFSDGSVNNFRYGYYDPQLDRGFAGKKIEMKHPNVATSDFEEKLKNANLVENKPNGRKTYLTSDNTLVVVGKDGNILTAYKINGAGSKTFLEPTTYDGAFQPQTPLNNTIPSISKDVNPTNINPTTQEASKANPSWGNNSLYPVIKLAKLEMGRKMLNEAIQKATTNQDKTTLAKLMQVKNTFDKTISDFAKQGKFEGDAGQVDKLIKARQNKAEYHNKWTNTKEANLKSAGANEVLDIVNNPNKSGVDVNKLLDPAKTGTTKQLQSLSKLKQVGGNEEFKKLREIYLNNLFTDISEKGGTGSLRGQSSVNKPYGKLINHLNDNLEKNPAVANKLLSQEEIEKAKGIRDIASKLARTEQAKPNRSIVAAIQNALKGGIEKFPVLGPIAGKPIINEYEKMKVRWYLNRMLKENRISEEQARKIGAKFGLVFGHEVASNINNYIQKN